MPNIFHNQNYNFLSLNNLVLKVYKYILKYVF